jgi:hypothetical protein
MSNETIAESLGIEFVEPEDLERNFPSIVTQKPMIMDQPVDDEDLSNDFEIARESLVEVLKATQTGVSNLSRFVGNNPQELDMYEALSKMSSTSISAATALVNLHRIKKQIHGMAVKATPKGDQTLIVEGDVTMVGTMGDILDRVKAET